MRPKKERVTRLDYCQYLLSSQINYTLTNFANHAENFSHDAANRYLAGDEIRPRLVWENVKGQVVQTPYGFVVFDDTVIDKNFSRHIELVRSQYSGNAHKAIKGIGVVTCVYVNPQIDQFWIIDYRIYDPDGDGKTKLDHMKDMLRNCVYRKELPFWAVLMDSWYATKDMMLQIERLEISTTVRSRIIARWMILAATKPINVWIAFRGPRLKSNKANSSRSKVSLVPTK